jgi:hypothetical protein
MFVGHTLLFRGGIGIAWMDFFRGNDIEDMKYGSCNLDVNVKSLSSRPRALLNRSIVIERMRYSWQVGNDTRIHEIPQQIRAHMEQIIYDQCIKH